jgi:hypothetical protein
LAEAQQSLSLPPFLTLSPCFPYSSVVRRVAHPYVSQATWETQPCCGLPGRFWGHSQTKTQFEHHGTTSSSSNSDGNPKTIRLKFRGSHPNKLFQNIDQMQTLSQLLGCDTKIIGLKFVGLPPPTSGRMSLDSAVGLRISCRWTFLCCVLVVCAVWCVLVGDTHDNAQCTHTYTYMHAHQNTQKVAVRCAVLCCARGIIYRRREIVGNIFQFGFVTLASATLKSGHLL